MSKMYFLDYLKQCIIVDFALDKRHLGNKNKKLSFLFCASLGLHYLCRAKHKHHKNGILS